MKIITIVGARPQFIKAAVVSRAIAKYNEEHTNCIEEILVHTGQHYDSNMSDIFFSEMHIPKPNYQLGIGGTTHGAMTGQMLEKIEEIVLIEKPDIVLVYGDTNSTLAGALAAIKLHVPVAHVEAGLRSFNMNMPEEVNRILTDRISKWLFCPTDTAVKNLQSEGFAHNNTEVGICICNVGDVMYDAALYYKKIARPSNKVTLLLEKMRTNFYLATIHRAENTDNPVLLGNIIRALDKIAENLPVILPIHPRTRKLVAQNNITIKNITLIEPVGYFDMITLLSNCSGVFTDSGGVQKEAFFFGKPCITMREETEWVELVEHGCNTLVGADYSKIMVAQQAIANQQVDTSKMLYGDGNAGFKIIQKLIEGCR